MDLFRNVYHLFRLIPTIGFQVVKYEFAFLFCTKLSLKPLGFSDSIELRTKTSDSLVFYQVFGLGFYNFEIDIEPSVIIDCGANIGLTSLCFSNKYPNSKIIAIEPEEENFKMMIRNTQKYPNIICLNKGLWKKSCYLEIVNSDVSSWAFMVKESEKKTNISAVSIPDLIKDFEISRIDILKIDIEGSEKEIFENSPEVWLPLVNVLVVELHDRDKFGCSQALFKALTPYQYETRINGENLIIKFHHN